MRSDISQCFLEHLCRWNPGPKSDRERGSSLCHGREKEQEKGGLGASCPGPQKLMPSWLGVCIGQKMTRRPQPASWDGLKNVTAWNSAEHCCFEQAAFFKWLYCEALLTRNPLRKASRFAPLIIPNLQITQR